MLHNLTGNPDYLQRAVALIDAAAANLTNSEGGLRDVRQLVSKPFVQDLSALSF